MHNHISRPLDTPSAAAWHWLKAFRAKSPQATESSVGSEFVAKSAPDGHTLLFSSGSSIVMNPFLYKNLPYDSLRDFIPVTKADISPLMLVVHPSLPVKSVAELVAYSRANPGKLNYGSGGVGATPFLATELMKSLADFDAVHVPYKGGAPALADLVAGQLSFMIENVPGTLPFVKDGKLRALAVTETHRSTLVPDLPTMQEAGVKGYEVIGWNGLFAPARTPPEILARLGRDLARVLASPAMKEQMGKLGAEPGTLEARSFADFVKAESARWGKIIKRANIRLE